MQTNINVEVQVVTSRVRCVTDVCSFKQMQGEGRCWTFFHCFRALIILLNATNAKTGQNAVDSAEAGKVYARSLCGGIRLYDFQFSVRSRTRCYLMPPRFSAVLVVNQGCRQRRTQHSARSQDNSILDAFLKSTERLLGLYCRACQVWRGSGKSTGRGRFQLDRGRIIDG